MIDFLTLASSSAGCCYLVTSPKSQPLLIECGLRLEQIQRFLWARGLTVSVLAGCLISHAHQDHCKAVLHLLQAGVDCYASPEAWDHLGQDHHRAHVLGRDSEQRVGEWLVRPFLAEHDAPGTLGFLIGAPDGDRLLYITDSSFVRYTFEPCSVIAIEANYDLDIIRAGTTTGAIGRSRFQHTLTGHMDIKTTIKTLLANDLSRVEVIYLLHLSAENSDSAAFKLAVERATGRPVVVCEQLAEGVR